jgi:hypothetical protein
MSDMSDPNIEMWLTQCRSGDPARQVEAIRQLCELKVHAVVPLLVEVLKSPDAVVRCTAAGALGHLGAKEPEMAGTALMDLLHDPSEIVRSEAVDALGILGYAPAIRAVMALLVERPRAACAKNKCFKRHCERRSSRREPTRTRGQSRRRRGAWIAEPAIGPAKGRTRWEQEAPRNDGLKYLFLCLSKHPSRSAYLHP